MIQRLWLIMASFLISGGARGASLLFLHPVELLGYEGSSIRLKVEIPCGGSFIGIAQRETEGATLELAAVIRQAPMMCAGVPQPVSIKIDYLDPYRFDSIASMAIRGQKRVDIRAPEDLYVRHLGSKGLELVASSSSACVRSVGSIVRVSREGMLEVGLLDLKERVALGSNPNSNGTCGKRHLSQNFIRGLSPNVLRRIRPLQQKPRGISIAHRYELRFAEIDRDALRADPSVIKFKRDCHHAPVGLVTKAKEGKGGRLSVGVLVAYYFNAPCSLEEGSESAIWDNLPLKLYGINTISEINGISSLGDNDNLTAKTVLGIERASLGSGSKSFLKIMHSASCNDKDLYVVRAFTSKGYLAVGLIKKSNRSGILKNSQMLDECDGEPRMTALALESSLNMPAAPLILP